MGAFGVQGRSKSRVGWGCVVVSCGGVVIAVLLLAMMVVVCSVIVICRVVVVASLSSMICIVGVGVVISRVGSSSGQGAIALVVGESDAITDGEHMLWMLVSSAVVSY